MKNDNKQETSRQNKTKKKRKDTNERTNDTLYTPNRI